MAQQVKVSVATAANMSPTLRADVKEGKLTLPTGLGSLLWYACEHTHKHAQIDKGKN